MGPSGCPDPRIDRSPSCCCCPCQVSVVAVSVKKDSDCRRTAVGLAAHHHGPDDAGHLVGQRKRGDLLRLARQQSHKPRRGAARLGLLYDSGGAEYEQPAQILVACFADPAEPLPTGGRVLARRDADPGGKMPARVKRFRVRHLERKADATDRPDAGDRRQALAGLILPVPSHHSRLDRLQLDVQAIELAGQTPIISRASAGTSSPVAKRCSSAATCLGPLATVTPNSAAWPRMALISIVRCLTSKSRTPSIVSAACCPALLTGTNRVLGRPIASQIASASIASFLPRRT